MENNMEHRDTNMEERMGQMENNMVERILKLIEISKENLPKVDYVAQGTHEDKDNAYVDQPSINKPSPRGFNPTSGMIRDDPHEVSNSPRST